MKKLGDSIHRLYHSERARWLFSLLIALALVGVAALLSTISYYDNDDLNIAWALAGYRTGRFGTALSLGESFRMVGIWFYFSALFSLSVEGIY